MAQILPYTAPPPKRITKRESRPAGLTPALPPIPAAPIPFEEVWALFGARKAAVFLRKIESPPHKRVAQLKRDAASEPHTAGATAVTKAEVNPKTATNPFATALTATEPTRIEGLEVAGAVAKPAPAVLAPLDGARADRKRSYPAEDMRSQRTKVVSAPAAKAGGAEKPETEEAEISQSAQVAQEQIQQREPSSDPADGRTAGALPDQVEEELLGERLYPLRPQLGVRAESSARVLEAAQGPHAPCVV